MFLFCFSLGYFLVLGFVMHAVRFCVAIVFFVCIDLYYVLLLEIYLLNMFGHAEILLALLVFFQDDLNMIIKDNHRFKIAFINHS